MGRPVIGLGSGRCGTLSLMIVLNKQPDVRAYHEMNMVKFKGESNSVCDNLLTLMNDQSRITVDVAYYYLNYVEDILNFSKEVKFVCFKRDKDETVNSWFKHAAGRNYWTRRDSQHWGDFTGDHLEQYFPKYDLPKREAIAQYYDDYYRKCEEYQEKYPDNFRIFDMKESLNTESGQKKMFEFIGIKNYKVVPHSKFNSEGERTIIFRRMPIKTGPCSYCPEPESAEWYVQDFNAGTMAYVCDKCKETNNLGHFKSKEAVCL